MPQTTDILDLGGIDDLAGVLEARVGRSPDAEAYRQPDAEGKNWSAWTWAEFTGEVCRWQAALRAEGLQAGDRVAIMLGNRREWAAFDMAALGLGLITVPLYFNDRPENIGLVLEDCGARLLFTGDQKLWKSLGPVESKLAALVVLDKKEYAKLAEQQGLSTDLAEERHGEKLEKILVSRIAARLTEFPGYAKIPRVGISEQPWSIESGLMTPTLKLRRERVLKASESEVTRLYAGH